MLTPVQAGRIDPPHCLPCLVKLAYVGTSAGPVDLWCCPNCGQFSVMSLAEFEALEQSDPLTAEQLREVQNGTY
jgi:hypothetical protein